MRWSLIVLAAAVACGGGDGGPGGVLRVSAAYPGAGPEDVEHALLEPMEQALSGVDGVQAMRGRAAEGAATVELTFRRGVDVARALAGVRASLASLARQLPDEVAPPVVQERPAAWAYARIGDDPRAADALRASLERLPVLQVETCGVRDARLSLELVPHRMAALGVTVTDVTRALREATVALPSARIDASGRAILVRPAGAPTYDEIADTRITNDARVRDVAVITERAETRCRVAGDPHGALLRVGVRRPAQLAAVTRALSDAGLTPLRGAQLSVVHEGDPLEVELVGGQGVTLEAIVVGDDAAELAAAAGAATVAAGAATGVEAAWCRGCRVLPRQQLRVDRARAADLGISVADVLTATRVALAGELVAERVDGDRRVGVVLGLEESRERWRDLPLRAASGAVVPLGALVSAEDGRDLAEIVHVDRRRAAVLRVRGGARTSTGTLRAIVADAWPGATARPIDARTVDGDAW